MELIIVPGGFESAKNERYNDVKSFCKIHNINLHFAPIRWHYRTFTQRQQQFVERYSSKKFDSPIILGFSWGAMIALISAHITNPKQLILCSLSPYRKEDLSKIPLEWRNGVGMRRKKDFEKHPFSMVKAPTCTTIITVGANERAVLRRRSETAHQLIKKSNLIIIPDSGHELPTNDFLKQILKI